MNYVLYDFLRLNANLFNITPWNAKIALLCSESLDKGDDMLMARRFLVNPLLFLHFFMISGGLYAQFNPDASSPKQRNDIIPTEVIHWQPGSAQLYKDGTIEATMQLSTEQDFTIYTTKLSVIPGLGYEYLSTVGPPPRSQKDPITDEDTEVYVGGDFRFIFKANDVAAAGAEFTFDITYLGCTVSICLFPHTEHIKIPLYRVDKTFNPSPTPTQKNASNSDSEDVESQLASALGKSDTSILMMMVIVFLGGLLTNLTPCVAPMIPITLRLLAKQKFSPLVNGSLYALGIMVTYTALGSVATLSGSAFGSFMQSSIVNIVFSVVMAALGFSMLGFGDLSALQNIGARFGTGQASAKNTFLMGAGAGLVAAPCTGPVLGALLTYAAGRQAPGQGMMLMAVYSFGFALPYVLLGSAASSMTKVRVSPLLQIGVKLCFTAIMFALSLYYLRVPAYGLLQQLKPFMGQIAVSGLGAGFLIAMVFIIVPSLQNQKTLLLIPCIVIAVGIFGGSQWITGAGEEKALVMLHSLDEAVAKAKIEHKPILVDNWAEWCEACKKMDVTTFKVPEVVNELNKNWIVAKLDLTESNDTNESYMEDYEITGLPTLILLHEDGDKAKMSQVIGYANAASLLKRLHEFKEP